MKVHAPAPRESRDSLLSDDQAVKVEAVSKHVARALIRGDYTLDGRKGDLVSHALMWVANRQETVLEYLTMSDSVEGLKLLSFELRRAMLTALKDERQERRLSRADDDNVLLSEAEVKILLKAALGDKVTNGEWSARLSEVRIAVDDLDDLDRDVLRLRFGQGMRSAAIGRHFGVAERTARWRVQQALVQVRDAITPVPDEDAA